MHSVKSNELLQGVSFKSEAHEFIKNIMYKAVCMFQASVSVPILICQEVSSVVAGLAVY
jgi:hypothetical protein